MPFQPIICGDQSTFIKKKLFQKSPIGFRGIKFKLLGVTFQVILFRLTFPLCAPMNKQKNTSSSNYHQTVPRSTERSLLFLIFGTSSTVA